MRKFNEMYVIGIDHGYGNMKTANCCFKTGLLAYDAEPLFTGDMLVYDGKYYLIGEGHKEFLPDKIRDEDYYILTLVAIAKELQREKLTEAKVIIAAGLPLTWTSGQKAEFKAYLSKNAEVEFVYKKTTYHIYIDDVRIYPQGYAAIASFATTLKGVNLIADIGNGTMNVLYMINGRPQAGKMYTEKFGTYQCTLAVREMFMQKTQREINDAIIEEVLITGAANIAPADQKIIRAIATEYVNSVDHILANMQYTGCTVNFKSSTVSFKVHKTVYNSPEDWVIIPNTQEAIIDIDTWERVQEIKKHRRRNTATGRQSIFSGLMYCGDCGSKLYFCAAKSVKEHQEFYRCSAYKENRGSCTIHYIRNVVLERMVLKLIREAAEYITEYEPVFLYLYSKQHQLNKANNLKAAKQELEKNKKRIAALDKLIEAAFEKNVLGTLRDDLFERMTANYEKEQRELIQAVAEAEQRLGNAEQDNIDLRAFLSIIRKCTDLKELTPELVNRLITKIEVFDSTKDENGKKHVPIKVHFIGVGVIVIPDGKTILETYEEIRKNPPRVA